MRRNLARRTLPIAFVATFVAGAVATVQAKGKDPQCSLAGVAGEWGFSDSGTVVGVGPRSAVGIFTLDAAGNVLKGKATVSLNGTISSEAFAGKVTVNSDCTGSATVDLLDESGNKVATLTTDFVLVDNMRELHELFTSVVLANGTPLATVITLNARKLFPEAGDE